MNRRSHRDQRSGPEVPPHTRDGMELLTDRIEHDQELELEPVLAEKRLDLVGHHVDPRVIPGSSVCRRRAVGAGLSCAGTHRSSLGDGGTNEGAPAMAYFTFGGCERATRRTFSTSPMYSLHFQIWKPARVRSLWYVVR